MPLPALRQWAGLLNAAVIVVFLAGTVAAARGTTAPDAERRPGAPGAPETPRN